MAYQQVELADLLDRLADRYEDVPYWTAPEATRALNESLRIWNAMTGFWRKPFAVTTIPNDYNVPVSGTLVQGTRVRWDDIPLEPVSLADLNYTVPNWRRTSIASAGAPSRPLYWARISLSLLAIYPMDTAITAVVVDGVRNTPILVNLTDDVDIGSEELSTLLGYAQHVLALKVGGQALVASYPGWLGFLQAGAARNRQFAASAYYRKLMGLDQQRRIFAPSAPIVSLPDQVLPQAGGGGGS